MASSTPNTNTTTPPNFRNTATTNLSTIDIPALQIRIKITLITHGVPQTQALYFSTALANLLPHLYAIRSLHPTSQTFASISATNDIILRYVRDMHMLISEENHDVDTPLLTRVMELRRDARSLVRRGLDEGDWRDGVEVGLWVEAGEVGESVVRLGEGDLRSEDVREADEEERD